MEDYKIMHKPMNDEYPVLAGDSAEDFLRNKESDKSDVAAEANSEEAEAFEPETI